MRYFAVVLPPLGRLLAGNEPATFTVSGSGLPTGLGFWIAECEGVTELAGGTSTSRQFGCTPSHTIGTKAGLVEDASGTELFSFAVELSTASGVVYEDVSDWALAASVNPLAPAKPVSSADDFHNFRRCSEIGHQYSRRPVYRVLRH